MILAVFVLSGCSSIAQNNSALLIGSNSNVDLAAYTPKPKPVLTHSVSFAQEGVEGDGEIASDLDVKDPFEGLNRVSFGINRAFDTVAFRPLSKVYGAVVPGPIRLMVRNILRNIDAPADALNYVLQGDGNQAGKSVKRFVINSTLGIGGAFDVADHLGTGYNPTDFGLTLDDWGVGEGNYGVIPLLGPTNTRDSVGRIVDSALSPTTYISVFTNFGFGGAIARGTEILDQRQRNGALLDNVIFASPDPYVSLRSTYVQRRRAKASGNVIGADGMDDALPVIVTSGS